MEGEKAKRGKGERVPPPFSKGFCLFPLFPISPLTLDLRVSVVNLFFIAAIRRAGPAR
jgi:hypothetical protein